MSQRISALKKEVKEIKTNLDNQARTAITSLSDDQVKSLLREKWLAPAMQSIFGIPAAVEGELRRKIQEIIKKYQNPISELNGEIEKGERQMEALMKQLVGNSFDMAAIAEILWTLFVQKRTLQNKNRILYLRKLESSLS